MLDGPFAGAFGGVHLLPFYVPIDGSDAGFDPTDHTAVDPRLGSWDDVARLGDRYTVMVDLIVNHVSADSVQFRAWLSDPSAPEGAMFLTPERVFGRRPTADEIARIYRPRPTPAFTTVRFGDGSEREVWTTFTSSQIDIDVEHELGWGYLVSILDRFAEAGVGLIRLDAVGYAIKRAGTSCFMIPETYEFIGQLADEARRRGMTVLVEIHGYHRDQIEIARRVDLVYDFALPPLAIDALTTGDGSALRNWIAIRPDNAINVLDTHDGIGVIDVGVDQRDPTRPGLLPPERIDALVEGIHERSGGASRRATGASASNLDLYQVNCTFYDAFGRDDRRYLAARLLQLLLPGTPQVYYVGLLAGTNDADLLERTGVGRDVNRHHYTRGEIDEALGRPVVRRLVALLRWRATSPAFEGTFVVVPGADHELTLRWSTADDEALEVTIDLRTAEVTTNDAALRAALDA